MIDFNRGNYETAGGKSDRQAINSLLFSRRSFWQDIVFRSVVCRGQVCSGCRRWQQNWQETRRVAQTPIVDKGFASVRKIGEGLYATISDPSKGFQTVCNGGFLVGKDGALLIEGFISAPRRRLSVGRTADGQPSPRKRRTGHSLSLRSFDGNAFYGAKGFLCGRMPTRQSASWRAMGRCRAPTRRLPGPLEKAVKEAKTETARKHREDYLAHVTNVFNVSNSSILALPNHPIDPAKLPMKVDLAELQPCSKAIRDIQGRT